MVALWSAHAQLSRFYVDSMVVANQALHEDTKVRGPGVEAIATVCDTWVGVTMV